MGNAWLSLCCLKRFFVASCVVLILFAVAGEGQSQQIRTVAARGMSAPGTSTSFGSFFLDDVVINDHGTVGFRSLSLE